MERNVKKTINVAVVGLGRISPRHIEDSIKQIQEFKLVAVCDIDKKRAKEIGKKEGVPFFTDYREMLKDKDIDLVSICTPNGFHYQMASDVLKAGKYCILEKPVAMTYKLAKKLVAQEKKSKGKLFPVLQVRYNPAIQVVKQAVEKGALGKILNTSLTIRWARPQEYYDESDWKGTLAMDGGSLLTQAIHYIDVMQYVLGPAKSVFGKLDRLLRDIEFEDTAHALIDFSSGARGNMEFTICTYPHNLECSLTILGEYGSVKLGGRAMNEIEIWEVKDYPKPVVPPGLLPNVYAGGMYEGSCPNHYFIYQDVKDYILHGKDLMIVAQDALESLRIIDGIKLSHTKGKEITL